MLVKDFLTHKDIENIIHLKKISSGFNDEIEEESPLIDKCRKSYNKYKNLEEKLREYESGISTFIIGVIMVLVTVFSVVITPLTSIEHSLLLLNFIVLVGIVISYIGVMKLILRNKIINNFKDVNVKKIFDNDMEWEMWR